LNLNVSNRKNGRVYLSIEKRYWDSDAKKSRNKTVKSIGYVDELIKDYPDPIAHFKELARKMTEEEEATKCHTLTFSTDEELPLGVSARKNFGYVAPLKVYHSLGLHSFLNNRSRYENFEFNVNSIMILLVVSRLLDPSSKKKAYENKGKFFERFDFSIDGVYRSLSYFAKVSKELQQHMYKSISSRYGSDTTTVYYDVTNYYFEIDQTDELRKYTGKPKQNRKKPVVQMGLAMDADGLPIHFETFPGNMLDKQTFRSVIGEVRRKYSTGRIVVVADMGIITGDNIYYLKGGDRGKNQNGYVFSFSVRGGTDDFKSYVLDQDGYTGYDGSPATQETDFKIKSRVTAREIKVSMKDGSKKTKIIYEKQVVFWGKKYHDRARAQRGETVKKALDLIASPAKYNKATSYGAAAYVGNIEYDKQTGEVCLASLKYSKRQKINPAPQFPLFPDSGMREPIALPTKNQQMAMVNYTINNCTS